MKHNNTSLLGKWYAKEPHRYRYLSDRDVLQYKMYIHEVDELNVRYDSFMLLDDGTLHALKVDRMCGRETVELEILDGHLLRRKS